MKMGIAYSLISLRNTLYTDLQKLKTKKRKFKMNKIIKLIFTILVPVIITVLLIYLIYYNNISEQKTETFIVIEKTYDYYIVYHKDTKVIYTVSNGVYNQGNFNLLVDSNGNPMIYDE